MDRIDWKRNEPGYSSRKKPQILKLSPQNFFCIKGVGNPNEEDFQRRVAALYAVSYVIRMSPQKNWMIPNYTPYTVYPLEGQWGLQEQYLNEKVMKKEHFTYRIMIKQPTFVTNEIAQQALAQATKKITNDLLNEVEFLTIEEGLIAQMLHIGPYEEERRTFEKLGKFIESNGYQRTSKEHKEIYLGDPRRADPKKLKTILRISIISSE
ncbi:MAG: GyrI-like domain-containing protein [Enterococcus lacertideformus]|uniref:GyrI-like domain-containing protein n=1 Tax=Enterococcus lacertideformus TaxID=2771493 RepID=A0A931AWS0_9ENTE|nr:GyrI-like domain-containing protein [Enterococcus lacertideformus]